MTNPNRRFNRVIAVSPRSVRAKLALAALLTLVLISAPAAPAQTFTLLYQFRSGPGGINPYAGVVRDAKGNLYGTTYNDGAFAAGTVFRINTAGKEKVLHSFSQTDGDGAFPWYGTLARDSSGNLYGTTITGGVAGELCCGTIFKVTAAGKETVLYRFTGDNGDGFPQAGVVRDSSGNLYGTTQNGGPSNAGTVFKVDPSGRKTILYSFTGSTDGAYPMAAVVLDAKGNLYGTTSGGGLYSFGGYGTVFKVDPAGKETVLYTFMGANDGSSPEAGVIRDSQGSLYGTTNLGGTEAAGTVFTVDLQGHETVLHNFAGGSDGWLPLGGSLVRDSAGNLYGTTPQGGSNDFGVVFKIDTKGNETALHNFSGSDGKIPYGTLFLDRAGNLYGTTYEGGAYGGGVVFKIAP
jgi:uncharacterized repeat protein (TIGR03803 family)